MSGAGSAGVEGFGTSGVRSEDGFEQSCRYCVAGGALRSGLRIVGLEFFSCSRLRL